MSLKVFVPASYPLLTYTWAFIFSILKCFYHISSLWFPEYFKQNQGFILTGTFLFEIFRLNLHCNIGQNIRSSSNETNVQWHFCKQRQSTYNHQNLNYLPMAILQKRNAVIYKYICTNVLLSKFANLIRWPICKPLAKNCHSNCCPNEIEVTVESLCWLCEDFTGIFYSLVFQRCFWCYAAFVKNANGFGGYWSWWSADVVFNIRLGTNVQNYWEGIRSIFTRGHAACVKSSTNKTGSGTFR